MQPQETTSPSPLPPRSLPSLALRLALIGFAVLIAAVSGAQPQTHTLQLIEGTSLEIHPADFLPAGFEVTAIVSQPSHGTLSGNTSARPDHSARKGKESPAAPFLYTPNRDFFGFDRLVLEAGQPFLGSAVLLELELRVLPRVLPISGFFDDSSSSGFGFYYLEERAFLLCDPRWIEGAVDGDPEFNSFDSIGTLTCTAHSVPGADPGWLPVVGDWHGTRQNLLPSLFDAATGTNHRLERTYGASELAIAESVTLQDGAWAWPVTGDWLENGSDQLALYRADGAIHTVDGLFKPNSRLSFDAWPGLLTFARPSEAFPWPHFDLGERSEPWISLRIDLQSGHQRHWLAPDGSSGIDSFQSSWTSIPLSHLDGGSTDLGVLMFRREGGDLWLTSASDLGGQTLALKFPNDPPDP
ncbi:MAG: hypothetical protein AAF725_15160 [Acidobacteriota bacterium]